MHTKHERPSGSSVSAQNMNVSHEVQYAHKT
jgi:hypothetical protein